jgi:hypothetical protein
LQAIVKHTTWLSVLATFGIILFAHAQHPSIHPSKMGMTHRKGWVPAIWNKGNGAKPRGRAVKVEIKPQ